jgi:hypothetical protein
MAESQQRKLSSIERWAVRLHHLSCSYCRRVFRQLKAVDANARGRVDSPTGLSDDARRRIAAGIGGRENE